MPKRTSNRSYGGAANFPRSRRVNQLLREVIAEEIERLSDADERLRMVTVTEVDTAADLRAATVYVSSLSDDAIEALEERRRGIQATVGRQAKIKNTPKLSFAVDPGVTQGAAIDEVLRRLAEREAQTDDRSDS
jgi:ribosome-binding factor A